MQQVWHIFKKDVRYLYREITFLLVLAMALYWLGAEGLRGDFADAFGVLVAIAASYTIARLVQAEALPGENQFWITRPYRRHSLLAAKLLFMVLFINLPILLAETAILAPKGFPFAWVWPGLAWMQVLVLICVEIPLAVVAALTTGLASFFGCILVVTLISLGQYWLSSMTRFATPEAMEWLRDSVGYLAFALFAPPILYLQYRLRRTQLARGLAIGLAVFGACVYVFISWKTLFPLQAWLSKEPVNLQVARDESQKVDFGRDGDKLRFGLTAEVRGVPEHTEMQVDSYSVSLVAADGKILPLGLEGVSMHRLNWGLHIKSDSSGPRGPDLPKFLRDNPRQPVTLHVSLYLTVFGNPRERTITLRQNPTDVMDGLQCFAGYLNQMVCRSPFRWPARMVSQRSGQGMSSVTRLISYSPFPTTLDLQPLVWRGIAFYSDRPLPDNREVTIHIDEPIAYLRRDLDIRDLYLDGR